ncbi:MAG: hypothetical protein LBQ87_09190 [Candidatus Fibromonas sp.]|nr:hypothetical protein [Candidatus Fibromonas sp.]
MFFVSCSSDNSGGNKIPDERNCNGKEYEPQTHFCFEKAIYEKCGRFAYNPKTNECDSSDSTLFNFCGTELYKPDISKYCFNGSLKEKETFTDIKSGRVYKSVIIGTQTWMTENLNINLPYFSKCYDDLESNCDKYGRLYNWTAAGSICPEGWHLPQAEEWLALINYVENGEEESNGRKLKASSGWEWQDQFYYGWKGNPNGTDEFGFSALPGGSCASRNGYENCNDIGYHALWWTDTRRDYQTVYIALLIDDIYYFEGEGFAVNLTSDYLSVRCVKD